MRLSGRRTLALALLLCQCACFSESCENLLSPPTPTHGGVSLILSGPPAQVTASPSGPAPLPIVGVVSVGRTTHPRSVSAFRGSWRLEPSEGGSISPSSGTLDVQRTSPSSTTFEGTFSSAFVPSPGYVGTVKLRGFVQVDIDSTSPLRSAEATLDFEILAPVHGPNRPPVLEAVVAPDPPEGPEPLDVRYGACGSSDPDGDELRYSFDFGDGQSDRGTCRTAHVFEREGKYTSQVCVTDGQAGHEVCRSFRVHVRPASDDPTPTFPGNRPPVIASFSADPPTVPPGGECALAAAFSDPDNDPLDWTLELDPSSTAGGTLTPGSGSGAFGATFTASGSPGTAVLRLTVSDGRGGTATRTLAVPVGGPM